MQHNQLFIDLINSLVAPGGLTQIEYIVLLDHGILVRDDMSIHLYFLHEMRAVRLMTPVASVAKDPFARRKQDRIMLESNFKNDTPGLPTLSIATETNQIYLTLTYSIEQFNEKFSLYEILFNYLPESVKNISRYLVEETEHNSPEKQMYLERV